MRFPSTRGLVPVAALAAVLALTPPSSAADRQPPAGLELDSDDAGPLLPSLAPPLNGMRGMIVNAQARFRNGIIDLTTSDEDAAFPGRSCCATNLQRIAERARQLDAALSELSTCYQTEDDAAMVSAAEFARGDLRNFATALESFAGAKHQDGASGALGAVTRAYLQLRTSAAALEPCGDSPRDADKGKAGKGKDKGKKKKSRDKSGSEP